MPFKLEELQQARQAYQQFLKKDPHAHHARYIFPFFAGTYFSYRKIDVLRVVAIARAVVRDNDNNGNSGSNNNPSYLDVGCGYGDFLKRVREYLPDASGVEKEGRIFYAMGEAKPDYIEIASAEHLGRSTTDVAFIGWMEPGQDFRKQVSKIAKCVITTFDAGGQCGINGGCEYDEFDYKRIAWWRTPSWIDVNAELMNRYYTPSLSEEKKRHLASLRSAHNFWYIYAKQELADRVKEALAAHVAKEDEKQRYDFEAVLDECGFGYKEELAVLTSAKRLWEVILD
jgi:SAM-dependent methyltransferase